MVPWLEKIREINRTGRDYSLPLGKVSSSFVELGGGVGDVLIWCRDGAYVEFDFR